MPDKPRPRKFTPAQPAPLPTTKPELAALAIDRGIPSYEAWAMTVPELKKKLEA